MNKSIALMALAAMALASCNKDAALKIDDAVAKKAEMAHLDSGKIPVAKFDNLVHDFGTIEEGIKVEHTYVVTNTGTGDLIISNAKPSCGCTVPDWTKDPIKPGEKGEVKVIFDSSHKSGNVEKTVGLTLNTATGTATLNFKANVMAKGSGIVPNK